MYSKIRLSGRGIVVHEGQVLLNHFENGGYYNIPGGGVEPGETAREAAQREVLEESGFEVSAREMMFFFDYEPVRNNFDFGGVPHMSTVFRCELTGVAVPIAEAIPEIDPFNEENISEPVWVDIEDIPNIRLVPEINDILYRLLSKGSKEKIYLEL